MDSRRDSFQYSVLSPANALLLEEKFQEYQQNPMGVPEEWRAFFTQLEVSGNGNGNGSRTASPAHSGNGSGGVLSDSGPATNISSLNQDQLAENQDLHVRALMLIQAYRRHGHFSANVDPLELREPNRFGLRLEDNRLSEADLDKEVIAYIANERVTSSLRDIVNRMEKIYCSSIGTEYYYIRDEKRRRWMMDRLEADKHREELPREVKMMIFRKLYEAESFEKFLATRFPGKKRFSLEGGESLIPALASVTESAGSFGIKQIVLGMAHRGRLNVLANIMRKDPALIFAEFNERVQEDDPAGDVKYHLGFSNDLPTTGGKRVHMSLAFNPSHLEVINPVVLGSVRARQTRAKDKERKSALPLILHGDAAFAGQGINYECLNMSGLSGYAVGGALHIIVNNQIGFTTGQEDARSTPYCTDLAKILQVPIFHVNGNDPEAVHRAIQLCLDWRQAFRTDAFLDLVCYRRLGHNETDEPAFTQPVMYEKIKSMDSVFTLYEKKLADEGFSREELDAAKKEVQDRLEDAFQRLENEELTVEYETLHGQWEGLKKEEQATAAPDTRVKRKDLEGITEKLTTVPEGFELNKKIRRLLDQRRAMVFEEEDGGSLDWGMAENMAYASLLAEGTSIRLSGQDSKRGTFSHRHAAVFDSNTGDEFVPMNEISKTARLEVINSLLSEMGALGFEFGYSLADPHTLVIWEAQFGDFVNNAQVIIDQFISSCEAKWNRMSGLVMLLPHGYEGQGPEHSSARLERFLQLCSQNNIQVCNLTTPAQFFHLLRRQMKREFRKPLVVMSPKSLLRHPRAKSTLDDLSNGAFEEIIDERDESIETAKVERLLMCSGKIYYELLAAREELGDAGKKIAIATLEQVYPYPVNPIADILEKYKHVKQVCWVQEEPRNQGAWIYLENRLESQVNDDQELKYFGRSPSPSPATGYFKVHQKEQQNIIDRALSL